jgi:hypothetical protein
VQYGAPADTRSGAATDSRSGAPADTGTRARAADRPRGGRGTVAVASGAIGLARLVMVGAVLIAVLIGFAILLRDVDANPHNTIVKGIHDAANVFAGAFTGLVTFHGHPKRAVSVDWGTALIAYLVAGAIVAGLIRHAGRSGLAWTRSPRAGALT